MATASEQLEELLSMMEDPMEKEDTSGNVTGIIYGDSGGGKTIEALKLAQAICDAYGGEILMIDAVNAWRSMKNHPELHRPKGTTGHVTRVPYAGKPQLDTLNLALRFKQPSVAKFKVVILDEMSSMTDKDGDVVLAARAAADDKKDPDVLTQPDMGATTERMRRTVTELLKQDISIIFVSHQRQDEDKQKGYAVTRPRFMPKFSGTIREGLDFVVHMSADESHRDGDSIVYRRSIQAQPTRLVVAKTRVGGLALHNDPDKFIQGVIKWMKGEVGDSTVDVVVDDSDPNAGSTDELSSDFSSFVVD
jgi:hypothetical protein